MRKTLPTVHEEVLFEPLHAMVTKESARMWETPGCHHKDLVTAAKRLTFLLHIGDRLVVSFSRMVPLQHTFCTSPDFTPCYGVMLVF